MILATKSPGGHQDETLSWLENYKSSWGVVLWAAMLRGGPESPEAKALCALTYMTLCTRRCHKYESIVTPCLHVAPNFVRDPLHVKINKVATLAQDAVQESYLHWCHTHHTKM